MDLTKLRKIRIAVSLLFFIVTSVLFLELSGTLSVAFSDEILFLQFIPSFLSFINLLSIGAIGFILIIVITVLWGRVYCSSVCPLGILIDIISRIKKRFAKRRRIKYKHTNPHNILRYSILVVVVLFFIAGSSLGIVLLDPYSNFGRLVTNFARPVIVTLNNSVVLLLEQFDNYSMVPFKHSGFSITNLIFPLIFLGLLLWLTLKNGRLYCNTVCPVGSLLGIISKFSIYKIKVDDDNCTSCGKCETVCKASCIDSKSKEIDFTRCVSCFNCFESCPTKGLNYFLPQTEPNSVDKSKRNFFFSTGLLTAALARKALGQGKEILVYTKNTIPEKKTSPITPPGSNSIEHFIKHCTACTLCVSACPTRVLQPSLVEYGINGFLMPHMNNHAGYCNFDCTICGDVCPNQAIEHIEKEAKQLVQIGKVKFEKDNCVVYTQKTDCGACAEHCPTKAVKMELDPELNLRVPVITEKICVGCGACEFACPTIPYRAIYVDGNPVHLAAEKPKQEKLEVDTTEDFPF